MADNFKSDYFNMPVHVSFNFCCDSLEGGKRGEVSADPEFLLRQKFASLFKEAL